MSDTTKSLGNYAKTLLALLKGDETELLALHNEKRARSSVKRQISSLEDRLTTLQEKVENAEQALHEAKYPTKKLDENSNYCSNIEKFQKILDEVKDNLADCQASLKYFEDLKKELSL